MCSPRILYWLRVAKYPKSGLKKKLAPFIQMREVQRNATFDVILAE